MAEIRTERERHISEQTDVEYFPNHDTGLVWKNYKGNVEWCRTLCGFPPQFIHSLAIDIMTASGPQRGKAPKMSLHDSVFFLLSMYCCGTPISKLAASFRISIRNASNAVNRVRPLVSNVLVSRHQVMASQTRPQVQPLPLSLRNVVGFDESQVVRDFGLAADCTPCRIPHPCIGFEAAKGFYDVHHGMYADKIEVAVCTSPPYKAIFWSRLHRGSEPDISIHRSDSAVRYTEYLTMTQPERAAFGIAGNAPHFWALVLDAGYVGSVTGVIYPRVVLQRPQSVQGARNTAVQNYYKLRRVVVEQFFGRMKKVFLLSGKPYTLDKSQHESDVFNMIMLTNEHIGMSFLTADEGSFYRRWLNYVRLKEKDLKEKHVRETQNWRRRMAVLSSIRDEEDVGMEDDEGMEMEVYTLPRQRRALMHPNLFWTTSEPSPSMHVDAPRSSLHSILDESSDELKKGAKFTLQNPSSKEKSFENHNEEQRLISKIVIFCLIHV